MKTEEITKRFTYHKPRENQVDRYNRIRDKARRCANLINGLCPESREKSIAITKLEESVMWANAAIARNEYAKVEEEK